MTELENIEKWRALLKELGAPCTEKMQGAIIMVRAPEFRADIYPCTAKGRWVHLQRSGKQESHEGTESFTKTFNMAAAYTPLPAPLSLKAAAKEYRIQSIPQVWIKQADAEVRKELTYADLPGVEAPPLKETRDDFIKSCALTPEQMAPKAPPIKADPLKSYLTLTAMNRPRPEYLLSDLGGLPPERNPRYAKKKPLPFELDADQANALRVILDPVNRFVVLIGKAGTGKSTVIGALEAKEHVAKTATTGRAAMNINGITLDRLFSYDRLYDQTRSERKLAENMEACPHIIVIDEASMIGLKMMNYIYKIALRFDKRIILVGDWAQASPVKDEWPVGSQLLQSCIVVKLNQVHRQSQGPYLAALDSLRQGEVTDLVHEVFKPCMVQNPPEDDHYIRLFATNRTTDSYNSARLNMGELSQRNSVGFSADLKDLRQSRFQLEYPMEPDTISRILEDSPFATVERFKAGARIVVTMNERVEGDDATPAFVNGDAGLLEHFIDDKGVPFEDPGASNPFMPTPVKIPYGAVVRLDRTGETVAIPYQVFQAYEANGDPIYEIQGMPLRLGWAITTHKCQGMTVDKAFVDMSSILAMIGESKHGLAYVALSRTRTLEGLQIFRWDDAAVFCAPVIKPYI